MLAISNGTGLDILRYAVGVIFLYHGLKTFMKPGAGLGWGMSKGVYLAMGIAELFSSVGLLLNIQIFLGSILLSLIAVYFIFSKVFRMRIPFSSSHATGWEFDFILLAASLTLVLANMPRT